MTTKNDLRLMAQQAEPPDASMTIKRSEDVTAIFFHWQWVDAKILGDATPNQTASGERVLEVEYRGRMERIAGDLWRTPEGTVWVSVWGGSEL